MQIGSTVTLAYKGTLADGTMFGYADAERPMKFQTGMDQAIDGFEAKVLELENVGDKASFVVDKYDAYGEYRDNYTQFIRKEELGSFELKLGGYINIYDEENGNIRCKIIEINEDGARFDMNHPLAGHDLHFEVEILDIEAPAEDFVPESVKQAEMERLGGMLEGGL